MVFAIHQHESATGIYVPPILSLPPTFLPTLSLWVAEEHWLWVPCFMPCDIYFTYGNVYVSMLFSQVIPPS